MGSVMGHQGNMEDRRLERDFGIAEILEAVTFELGFEE